MGGFLPFNEWSFPALACIEPMTTKYETASHPSKITETTTSVVVPNRARMDRQVQAARFRAAKNLLQPWKGKRCAKGHRLTHGWECRSCK